MNPLSWYLMSNVYANRYPATALDFRTAVPPIEGCSAEWFQLAGDLFAAGFTAREIRKCFK